MVGVGGRWWEEMGTGSWGTAPMESDRNSRVLCTRTASRPVGLGGFRVPGCDSFRRLLAGAAGAGGSRKTQRRSSCSRLSCPNHVSRILIRSVLCLREGFIIDTLRELLSWPIP